jgi:Aldehyde dehydrogenase family
VQAEVAPAFRATKDSLRYCLLGTSASINHVLALLARMPPAFSGPRCVRPMCNRSLRDGVAKAQKCALGCDFYAEHAERILAREPVTIEARKSFVTFNPLGVILAVMPWNFPFWQVFRFAAPGLMAGNAAVLKHASNCRAARSQS